MLGGDLLLRLSAAGASAGAVRLKNAADPMGQETILTLRHRYRRPPRDDGGALRFGFFELASVGGADPDSLEDRRQRGDVYWRQ